MVYGGTQIIISIFETGNWESDINLLLLGYMVNPKCMNMWWCNAIVNGVLTGVILMHTFFLPIQFFPVQVHTMPFSISIWSLSTIYYFNSYMLYYRKYAPGFIYLYVIYCRLFVLMLQGASQYTDVVLPVSRLIFNMEIPIPRKDRFYFETGPRWLQRMCGKFVLMRVKHQLTGWWKW